MSRPAARSAPKRRAPAKKRAAQRRRQEPGALDRALASLPLSEATIRRITTWAIVLLVGGVGLAIASWAGLTTQATTAAAEAVGQAGFRLRKIEITGLKHMDRNTVYAQALDQQSRAMPLIDLTGVRNRLLQYPWIEDARVSRRMPDTLAIQIVEREPAAIWQHDNGRLTLIDAKGAQIEPVSPEAMPPLPLLIGPGANYQEAGRRALLEAAPVLKPLVKAAAWIGNRRWDLTFDTGERLQLPEGDEEAKAALVKFAELDGQSHLLGTRYVNFDMRDPDNIVLREKTAPPAATPAPIATPSPTPAPVSTRAPQAQE